MVAEDEAAVRIQSRFRGYQTRKTHEERRKGVAPAGGTGQAGVYGEDEEKAATRIQARVRGRQTRQKAKAGHLGSTSGASIPAKVDYSKDPEAQAAVKIQAQVRGRQTRKKLAQHPPPRSASSIPSKTDYSQIEYSDEQRQAAVRIQSRVRGAQTRQRAKGVPTPRSSGPADPAELQAAVKIQASYRGHATRKKMKGGEQGEAEVAPGGDEQQPEQPPVQSSGNEVKAATDIQRAFRGHVSRKYVAPGMRVTATFVIAGDYEGRVAKTFPSSATVFQLKEALREELDLPDTNIILKIGQRALNNEARVGTAGFDMENGSSVVDVLFSDVDPTAPTDLSTMPESDHLEVEVDFGGLAPSRIVHVELTREKNRKLYLGGYRSKKTGVEFHNATAQTNRPPPGMFGRKIVNMTPKFHRETQTAQHIARSTQNYRECSTQMAKPGCYDDQADDLVLVPRPYFDANALYDLRYQKALIIQCCTRGMFARNRARALRQELYERKVKMIQDEQERIRQEELKHKKEINRRMRPKTFEDFEILYNELEAWRQKEAEQIKEMYPDGSRDRTLALSQLLAKETKLLQTIDRLKTHANSELKDFNIKKTLEDMASPKKWALCDGAIAEVHTPFTTRARELLELYNGLNLPLLTIDERLDVLLHVKWTVKEFDCHLTRDLVDLIDREADMLNRGRSEASLAGLRKRISNMFLQFIQTPEFNPEAARFQKVPRELLVRPAVQPITVGGEQPAQM